MPNDERLTWDFIFEVLDAMERHGYHGGDNQHTAQAIGLIRDVARIYEGTLDAPRGGYVVVPSSRPAAPQPPGVIVSAGEVKTLLAALDEAAEYKRDRAETCADCAASPAPPANGACRPPTPTTVGRQIIQAAQASATRQRDPDHEAPARDEPHAAAEPEARQ